MGEMINPIEILGPTQCRQCGSNMELIIASADAIHLDHDGNPEGIAGLIEESYMLCRNCGNTAQYSIDKKSLSYKIIDPIDSFGNFTEDQSIEEFDAICNDMNPFHIRDEMRYNNLKGD